MKIIKLQSSNVKRLNAVTITPNGEVVIIGGRNGQGKTSVLDSIAMALGGGEQACDQPLKEGAESGETSIWFDDDLVVTRRYNKSGTTSLTVQTKAGAKFSSPQAILDKLVGKLTFDPLEFARLKPLDQRAILQQLAKLDFAKLDQFYSQTFEERTAKGREVKRLEGVFSGLKFEPGLPEVEATAADLNERLNLANEKNQENSRARLELSQLNRSLRDADQAASDQRLKVQEIEQTLKEARAELEKRENSAKTAKERHDKKKDAVSKLRDDDTTAIVGELSKIEDTNKAIRDNQKYRETETELKNARGEVDSLTSQLQATIADKEAQLRAAKLPIEGLSFTDTGVTFNGKPFSQASEAEKLRVSVAMGMAANPTLKILLCRDGSLLDADSMKLLSEIVTVNGFQLWLERVGDGDETAVIIEDGFVKTTDKKKK